MRPRLVDRLAACQVGIVTAPAGSGKTTLLWHAATGTHGPVAWYPAGDGGGTVAGFLAGLAGALGPLIGAHDPRWTRSEDLARAASSAGEAVLLVVDDAHALEGTPAAAALGQVIVSAPPRLRVLVGSRLAPGVDLSALRVSGALAEVGPEDLRFRAWEVESLFRVVYREPLAPETVADLARRTGGWAACLQLFHLAMRHRSPTQQRRVLASLDSHSRLVGEYLASQVLDELPEDLRIFLVRTSLLRRPTPELCDALLGRSGSAAALAELHRRQLCTVALDEEGAFRYHDVLRSHLEGELLAGLGEEATVAEYRRAGDLLAGAGQLEEAAWVLARAGDREGVGRLLDARGDRLTSAGNGWLDAMHPSWAGSDPWLCLAAARRELAEGRFAEALACYRRGAHAPGGAGAICRREAEALAAWAESPGAPGPADPGPGGPAPGGWLGLLRAAVTSDPLAAAEAAASDPSAGGRLAEGAALFLHGDWERAASLLWAAGVQPDASAVVANASRILAAVAEVGLGLVPPVGPDLLAEQAEAAAIPWLARAGAALAAVGGPTAAPVLTALETACQRSGDTWGAGVMGLLAGLDGMRADGPPLGVLERAARAFGSVGAPVLRAWCLAVRALSLARLHHPESRAAADEARAAAIACVAAGPAGLAALAQALSPGAARSDLARARSELVYVGLWDRGWLALSRWPQLAPGPGRVSRVRPEEEAGAGWAPARAPASEEGPGAAARVPPVLLRCFGAFRLELDGVPAPLGEIKPKARELLRLLAAHVGRPVHREALVEALWPEADPAAGVRNLQVAISALRRALDPGAGRGSSRLIARDGEAYRLALPEGSDADLLRFESEFASARQAKIDGDGERAASHLRAVLAAHEHPLLAEDGPAEWVGPPRRRYQAEAAAAALDLARLELERGSPEAAAAACERGVAIDRYRDELWRLLVEARTRSGEHAAAQRARRAYRDMLAELGLESPTIAS